MKLQLLSVVFGLTLAALPPAFQASADQTRPAQTEDPARKPLADAPLAGHRKELLELGFRSASALPLTPHIKTRSRAQEGVLMAYIDLGQLASARTRAAEVANWRRGAVLAEVAYADAKNGAGDHVADLVAAAAETLEELDEGETQAWRRDRVRTKIARALLADGKPELAATWSMGAEDSEVARLATEAAHTMTAEEARDYLETIDRVAEVMVFEQLVGTLEVAADLHGLHYMDAELRMDLEERIRGAWGLLPIGVRLSLLADMADGAAAHGDDTGALRLLDEAAGLMKDFPWAQMRNHVPVIARLAQSRAAAGDAEGASAELHRGLAVFRAGQESTPDVFQARALRPLAAAAHTAGEAELATELFALTVEVGLQNPNGRPRAEDLAATAAELAVIGFEPSPELWGALRDGLDGLKAPW